MWIVCMGPLLQVMIVRFVCGTWKARRVSRKSRLIVKSLTSRYMTLHFIHRNHSSPVRAPTRWPKCLRDVMPTVYRSPWSLMRAWMIVCDWLCASQPTTTLATQSRSALRQLYRFSCTAAAAADAVWQVTQRAELSSFHQYLWLW